MRYDDERFKHKLNYMLEKSKPLIEAKKKVQMKKRQGKNVSKNEKYCFVRLESHVSEKYPELEVVESDIDTMPGWEIDILVKSPYGWNIAVEWDGAYHRKPIYGESKLRMRKAQDEYKNKVLHSMKYALIRVVDNGSYNPQFVETKLNKIFEIIDDFMEADVVAFGKIEI